MSYFGHFENEGYENLLGGSEFTVETANVSVTGGCSRGDILAGNNNIYSVVSSTADTVKPLAVAYENNDSTDTTVCTVYTSGKFNISGLSAGVDVAELEEALRRDNIILTDTVV